MGPIGPGSEVTSLGGASADGTVVVGGTVVQNGTTYSFTSFRWRRDGGFDEPVAAGPNALSASTGISEDGWVVAGTIESTFDSAGWVVTGQEDAVLVGERRFAGVSGDGTTIVGWIPGDVSTDHDDHPGVYRVDAHEWTALALPPEVGAGRALHASFDGTLVVGVVFIGESGQPAGVVWNGDATLVLDGPGDYLAPDSICADRGGAVVAGSDILVVEDPVRGLLFHRAAWRWSPHGGMMPIGPFEVRAVAGAGRVIAGAEVHDQFGVTVGAMVWDGVHGLRRVDGVLASAGLGPEIEGWDLQSVESVSIDGTAWVLTGMGREPRGSSAAWIARVPLDALVCPADIDLNGWVNGDDVDTFAAAFDAGGAGADFDGNGYTNGDDADAFWASFDAGC